MVYQIAVENTRAAPQTYDLSDTFDFDSDFTILSVNVSNDAGVTTDPTFDGQTNTTIATGVNIAGNTTHTYTIEVTVDASADPGSVDDCDADNPQAGRGLFNEATMTVEGTPSTAETCPPTTADIGAAKAVSQVTPAASGTLGNFDVPYTLVIQNTGSVILTNLSLVDDLSAQFGGAFVGIVTPPAITASTATTDPTLNGSYDGTATNPDMFIGADGVLEPGQQLTVILTIEVDPDSPTANLPLGNQATASGVDVDDPTNTATDLSDSGADPDGTNPDEPGDTGEPDDPTPLPMPAPIPVGGYIVPVNKVELLALQLPLRLRSGQGSGRAPWLGLAALMVVAVAAVVVRRRKD